MNNFDLGVPLLMTVYMALLAAMCRFPKTNQVPLFLGGGFTPHALLVSGSATFIPVTGFWFLLIAGLEASGYFIEGHSWTFALPIISKVLATIFVVTGVFSFYYPAVAMTEGLIPDSPQDNKPSLEKQYPTVLIGANDDPSLLVVLQDPQIAATIQTTPFQEGIRELDHKLLPRALALKPDLWVQPIHTEIHQRISFQVLEFLQRSHEQAEKSIDAQRQMEITAKENQALKTTIADLEASNKTLNDKLISMRTRSRPGGAGDSAPMTPEQLDTEYNRLAVQMRKLEEDRNNRRLAMQTQPSGQK